MRVCCINHRRAVDSFCDIELPFSSTLTVVVFLVHQYVTRMNYISNPFVGSEDQIRLPLGVTPITQLRMCVTKIIDIQGRSPNVASDCQYRKILLLKEINRSLWEQVLSFKRSSNFEKRRTCKESLLVPVAPL